MAAAISATPAGGRKSLLQRLLDGVEVVGNKVPHPVILFLYLIAAVIVICQILYILGVIVTEEVVVHTMIIGHPVYYEHTTAPGVAIPPHEYTDNEFEIQQRTIPIRGLLTIEGIRFIFTSFVTNFAGFNVVAVIFVAMVGVGVAEEAGMMAALIRKLVQVAPAILITFIIVLTRATSTVA